MFLWLNLILSCVLSFGFKPIIYNDFRNTNFSTDSMESLNCGETKVRDNLIQEYGYLVVAPYEFFSSYALVEYLGDTLRNPPSINATISMPYLTSDTRLVSYSYVNASYNDYGYSYGLTPVSAVMTCITINDSGTSKYVVWRLEFTFNHSGGTGFIDYTINYTYNNLSSNTSYIGCPSVYISTYNVPTSINNNPYIVATTNSWLYNLGIGSDDYRKGYNEGYTSGETTGYINGYNYASGVIENDDTNPVHETIYNNGYTEGHSNGYTEGIQYAQSQDTTALTIFTGIVDIGLLPVNVFLKIFEFEVFGINIAGALSALLTIAVTFIVLRFVTGKKDD